VQPFVINIAGRQTKVNVASANDATVLAGLLQQLEGDGARYDGA
jgi:hypothetical protein